MYAMRGPFGCEGGSQVTETLVLLIGWMLVISGELGSPFGSVAIGWLSCEYNGGKSCAMIQPIRNWKIKLSLATKLDKIQWRSYAIGLNTCANVFGHNSGTVRWILTSDSSFRSLLFQISDVRVKYYQSFVCCYAGSQIFGAELYSDTGIFIITKGN
jgi:hypothetical protein